MPVFSRYLLAARLFPSDSLPSHLRPALLRAALVAILVIGTALSAPAAAVGRLADITVIDRDSGQVLPLLQHQGRYYVAGRPGARYAVRVHNRSNARVMAVMAVDGVNVVSGDTASWEQNGYVLSSWQRHDVAGWRKSQSEIAAFEFTALANSYAARTGRPENVGVIGVALFRELVRELPVAPPPAMTPPPRPRMQGDGVGASARDDMAGAPARTANEAGGPGESSTSAESASASARKSAADIASASANASGDVRALIRPAPQPESKLGTGHGQRENAWVSYTEFQRAQSSPNEVIAIYYDSRENLIAQGVIPVPRALPGPQAFPAQPQVGFVPDPPRF